MYIYNQHQNQLSLQSLQGKQIKFQYVRLGLRRGTFTRVDNTMWSHMACNALQRWDGSHMNCYTQFVTFYMLQYCLKMCQYSFPHLQGRLNEYQPTGCDQGRAHASVMCWVTSHMAGDTLFPQTATATCSFIKAQTKSSSFQQMTQEKRLTFTLTVSKSHTTLSHQLKKFWNFRFHNSVCSSLWKQMLEI